MHPLNSRSPRLRVALLVAAVAALAAIVAGTSSGRTTADKPTIAFVSQGTSNSWAAQLDAVAKKTADKLGVNLVYYNGQGDATKQLPELQRAIATKPDALVVVPLGQAADTGPVERAMAQGTKVILCDSMVNTDNYTSLVNPDPSTAAKPLAEWLAKRMHYKGNLLYIGGLPGNGTTILYDKGFNAVIKKYPNIKVVNGGNANYSISTAKQLTATAIASGKKFDGTWGVGGEAVTGILQAYIDAKVKPIPPNAGAAATNGSLRLAVENNLNAAMLQFPPGRLEGLYRDRLQGDQGREGAEADQHLGAQGVRKPLSAAQALLQAAVQRRPLRGHRRRALEEGACCDPPDEVAAGRREEHGWRASRDRSSQRTGSTSSSVGSKRSTTCPSKSAPRRSMRSSARTAPGKSTLVKIMTGAQRPDAGTVAHPRRARRPLTPEKARELGIGAVYQEPSLVPYLTVLENMFLGRELRHVPGVLERRAMRRQARQALDRVGVARRARPRGLRAQRRRAPARRDRTRAGAQRARPHLRRAVGDPLRPRAGARVRGHPGAQGERPRHPLHLAPARGDLPPRRPRDRAEGRPRRRDAQVEGLTTDELIRLMVGRDIGERPARGGSRRADRAGGAGRGAAPGRRADRLRAARGRGARRRRPRRLEPLAARERPRRDPARAVGQACSGTGARSGSGGLATPCVPASSSSRRTGSARD